MILILLLNQIRNNWSECQTKFCLPKNSWIFDVIANRGLETIKVLDCFISKIIIYLLCATLNLLVIKILIKIYYWSGL